MIANLSLKGGGNVSRPAPQSNSLNPSTRIKTVAVLGILFLALILHDLYWIRSKSIIETQSFKSLLSRLRNYLSPGMIGIIILLLIITVTIGILLKKRRNIGEFSRYGHGIGLFALTVTIIAMSVFLFVRYRQGVPPIEWSLPVALLVLISLLIFAIISRKNLIILGHIVLGLAAVFVFMTSNFFSVNQEKLKHLEKWIEQEKQNLFVQKELFSKINLNKTQESTAPKETETIVYHFDDHAGEILSVKAPVYDSRTGILLEIPKSGGLTTRKSPPSFRLEIDKGVLTLFGYKGGTLLQSKEALGLELDSIGSVVIRMKASAGENFRLLWSEGNAPNPSAGIQIPLASPGEYHNYEIREAICSISTKKGIHRIDRIFLMPSDQDADVEIEFLRVMNKLVTRCRENPIEVGYENTSGEIRKVLYARSPSELIYSVRVPTESPILIFGTAIADSQIPVLFQIAVRKRNQEKVVLSEAGSQSNKWQDHKLGLDPWSGQDVQIVFRTSSEKPNVGLWSNPTLLGATLQRLNIVVLLIDALRADHLGAYGYQRNTSPGIDQLALKGCLFENAYSNGCTTKQSVPSIFSSNPTTALGMWESMSLLPETFVTLPEIFRSVGYSTAAFTAGANIGPYTGTHRGFCQLFEQQYFRHQDQDKLSGESPKRIAEHLIGDSLTGWLDENANRSFFLYIHTGDVHGPYDPPKEYHTFFEKTGRPVLRLHILDPPWLTNPTAQTRIGLYDGAIQYTDVHIERLLNKLRDMRTLDHTLFIITADHGEYFGEHGMWGHNPPPYVQGTHVPLIIVWPNQIPGNLRIRQNVQLMDLMPTILEAAGLESGPSLFQGKSLIPLMRSLNDREFEERVIYVEGSYPRLASIHLGQFHYIPEKDFLFDLSSDPEEKHYLSQLSFNFRLKSRLRKLAEIYGDTYSVLNRLMKAKTDQTFQINAETLEQLRTLGYIK